MTYLYDKNSLVSIIIPTYNRPFLLKRAIDSVLMQSFGNFELIIVDNCDFNRADNVVAKYDQTNMRYIFNNEVGPSNARNRGILESKGDYIAFLDDDDEYERFKIEKQIKHLYPKTDYYWTYGAGTIVSKNSKEIYYPKYKFCTKFLLGVYSQILMPSLLFRKECFENDNTFDVEMLCAEDWDLWYRIGKKYRVKATNDIVYTVHYDHAEERLNVETNRKVIDGVRVFKYKHFRGLTLLQKLLFSIKNYNYFKKNEK